MKIKKPSLAATKINEDVWYYENRGSLDFVVYTPEVPGKLREVVQFRVPLSKIEKSIKRN
jgi:hypothetical protein